MSKKKLTTIYQEIQNALGFTVKSKGEIVYELAGVETPYTINKKQLVIPTDEWLKDPDWDNTIPFHPLSENTQRKRSEVLESLTLAVSNRLFQVGAGLIDFLFQLAFNTDGHKKLTPEQREVLRILPNVDARAVTDVQKLIRTKLTFKGETAFINIFIKRSGLWRGEEYPRVAIVTFPLYDQQDNEDKKIFDVLFRVRDRAALFDLIRWIYPGFNTSIDTYSYGSRSSVAPNFHSLMMAFASLAECTNKVVRTFEEGFEEEMKGLLINTKWLNNLSTLSDYKSEIPPLDGNIGEANEDELKKVNARAERKEKSEERKELRRDVSSGRRGIIREREHDETREDRRVSLIGNRDRDDDRGGRERQSIFGNRGNRDDRYDLRDSRDRDDRRDSGRKVSLFTTRRR